MTRLPSTALAVCLLLVAPTALAAQKVLIHGATRADVVREVNNQLSDQGFKLEDTTKSEARWGLASMQQLLDIVKTSLDARRSP